MESVFHDVQYRVRTAGTYFMAFGVMGRTYQESDPAVARLSYPAGWRAM